MISVLGKRTLFQHGRSLTKAFSTKKRNVDVTVNENSGVATVSLNRGPNNALNLELLTDLNRMVDELSSNRCKGMILTSAMPTIFTAGLDITELIEPDMERFKSFITAVHDCWLKLYTTPFPTAAAINGHSPAGGCLLAMCCEYRVMVCGKYTIGLNETKLGLIAPQYFVNTMRGTISNRDAEMALTMGKLFLPEEALEIKLIDEIASEKGEAIAKCEQWISQFKKVNPMARTMTKLGFRQNTIQQFEDTRKDDMSNNISMVQMPQFQAAIKSYVDSLKKK